MAIAPKKQAGVSKVPAKQIVEDHDEDMDAPVKSTAKAPAKPVAKPVAKPAAATATATKAKPKTGVKKPSAASVEDVIGKVADQLEQLDKDSAKAMVHSLQDAAGFNDFQLGGVLSTIQANGWFTEDGYESFKACVEAEFGIQYRKAMYLIGIFNDLTESEVPWHSIAHLGWTKIKELAPVMTLETYEEWVETAEDMTVLQLQEYIKQKTSGTVETSGETGKEDAKASASQTTTFSIKVHADQKEIIKEAIDKAKHEADTEFDAVAMEAVCMSYINGDSGTSKKAPSLKSIMKKHTWEEVLEAFEQLWPDVQLTIEEPESEEYEEDEEVEEED